MPNESATFKVDDVAAKQPDLGRQTTSAKWHEHYLRQELARLGVKNFEAYNFNSMHGNPLELIRPDTNSFLHTVLMAYDDHVPLTLSPDDVWIACVQAVAKYISLNPEGVRHAIVPFEGQQTLHIFADDFVKGSPENDWQRVFGQFGDQIETYLGKKRDMFDPTFSTTTPIEKAAIQVQMMAALAPFFKYTMSTCCGIPYITLLGEIKDWEGIVSRVQGFGEFYPKWFHDPLMLVVNEFLEAAKGNANRDFWKNFAKSDGGSGGPYVSGYINAFFPWLGGRSGQNALMKDGVSFEDEVRRKRVGGKTNAFPGSVSSVPVLWNYYGTEYKMQLASGIFGTTVYNNSYRPAIGWVIGEAREAADDDETEDMRHKAYKELRDK